MLAGWRQLLDNGVLQDGDDHLAGTRSPASVRMSPVTAAEIGAVDGGAVTVTGPAGSLTLPLAATPDMPDRVVWVPLNSTDGGAARTLGAGPGRVVGIAPAGVGARTTVEESR
jgi:NADH-quinone oxidoreductase subunit G